MKEWSGIRITDKNKINQKSKKYRKKESKRKKKWKIFFIGIIILLIGIVGLILSGIISKENEVFGAGFFGFGLILLISGILVIIFAVYKIAHIEYGF
ncbi:MAG: hypothetical protein ACFFD2_00065 [Promethearchaeota archaeon]